MRKILLIFIATLFAFSAARAQYDKAVGLRGGLSQGITFKYLTNESSGFEFIGSTRYEGVNLTVLFENHNPLGGVENLYYYYGFGGHLGWWDVENTNWEREEYETGNTVIIGGDVILGIEYVFDEIPLSLSIDWKPAFNFIGHKNFWGDNGALSVRYTF
ncbi:MAG: hypothetical protein ACLFM1_11545 [Bacteroidales bacterium]